MDSEYKTVGNLSHQISELKESRTNLRNYIDLKEDEIDEDIYDDAIETVTEATKWIKKLVNLKDMVIKQ